jgi:hypothetical protein
MHSRLLLTALVSLIYDTIWGLETAENWYLDLYRMMT